MTLALAAALFCGSACTGPGLAGSVRRYRRPEAEGPRQGHGHRLAADPANHAGSATPVTIISAEDIQARGFNNVAEVLQGSSFSTGGVQNNQSCASFAQGATLSLFGLSASYVKYLIDGRPMANYPALYNGSDVFNNISGIPVGTGRAHRVLPVASPRCMAQTRSPAS